jgi:hypothetical protein
MSERLTDRCAAALPWLLWPVFLTAAPWFLPSGGYTRITLFKFILYLCLMIPFLLLAGPGAAKRLLRRKPGFSRLAVLALMLLSLLSALLSPWPGAAFLGGSRREGFLTLLTYYLGFLVLSAAAAPDERALYPAALGVAVQDILCILQLEGFDPLGLYPPGMGWGDANILYPGSYLGTVGNAGAEGALLCAAAALFWLSLLRRGGRRLVLALPLLASCYVLGRMGISAPLAGLYGVLLLTPAAAIRTRGSLRRFLLLLPLLLLALHPDKWRVLLPGEALCAAAGFILLRRDADAPLPRSPFIALTAAGAAGAVILAACYTGTNAALREASALLRGRVTDEMGNGRIYIWRQVLSVFPRRPILGSGPDTLGLLDLPPYVWYSAETGRTVVSGIDAAHCEYLQTLVCQGLPAALCHLALAASALVRFLRRGGAPSGVCAGAALCYGLQALFGISTCAAAPVFWLLLGASQSLADREAAEASH